MKIWKKIGLVLGLFAVFGVAGASSCSATDDRINGNKDQPDTYSDVTNVTVYRNANNVPNVATFCVGEYAFASTLSGGDGGTDKASTLIRMPQLDVTC